MAFFFFRPFYYERFYNCSSYNLSMVPLVQRQKPLLGSLSIGLGIILGCVYLPCLFAISRPKLFKQSCYQLMFFLGVVNVTQLLFVGILAGIFAIFGTVYCSQPYLLFWHGMVGTALFFTEIMASCVLALNRVINFRNALLADRIFDGLKTLTWIFFMLIGTFFMAFMNPPHIYSPIINSFVQNPHLGFIEELDTESVVFYSPKWSRNCSIILLSLNSLVYVTFLVVYISKRKETTEMNDRTDRSIFVQILWISVISFFVNLAYAFDYVFTALSFGQYIIPLYTYGKSSCHLFIAEQNDQKPIEMGQNIRRRLSTGRSNLSQCQFQ